LIVAFRANEWGDRLVEDGRGLPGEKQIDRHLSLTEVKSVEDIARSWRRWPVTLP